MKKSKLSLLYIVICISTLGFLGLVTFVIHLANTDQPSVILDIVRAIPYGDKILHALVFGLLCLGFNTMLVFRKFRGFYVGTLGLSIVVVAEEISQYFSPHRTFDFIDLLADAIGIATFTYITLFIERRHRQYVQ